MNIICDRIEIRPFAPSDLTDVHEYCSQPGVGENAGWKAHSSLAETESVLSEWIEQGCKNAIVLSETGKVIGHISVDPDSEEEREDTRELGFVLNRDYHRKGIMTEAVNAILGQLFGSGEIKYVWACCFQDNAASKALIGKCGFRLIQEGTYYAPLLEREFRSYEYRMSKREWLALNRRPTR